MSKYIRFHSPTKGDLSVTKMISDISDFVDEEAQSFYRLVIGTDSQARRTNGKSQIDYVTAIVVHRIGKGRLHTSYTHTHRPCRGAVRSSGMLPNGKGHLSREGSREPC